MHRNGTNLQKLWYDLVTSELTGSFYHTVFGREIEALERALQPCAHDLFMDLESVPPQRLRTTVITLCGEIGTQVLRSTEILSRLSRPPGRTHSAGSPGSPPGGRRPSCRTSTPRSRRGGLRLGMSFARASRGRGMCTS